MAGATTHSGQILMSTQRTYHFAPLVASDKKISLKYDFIHTFHWFYTCVQPHGTGSQPLGDKILMSTERPFVESLKKTFKVLILYIFFHVFIHVYSPVALQDPVISLTGLSAFSIAFGKPNVMATSLTMDFDFVDSETGYQFFIKLFVLLFIILHLW